MEAPVSPSLRSQRRSRRSTASESGAVRAGRRPLKNTPETSASAGSVAAWTMCSAAASAEAARRPPSQRISGGAASIKPLLKTSVKPAVGAQHLGGRPPDRGPAGEVGLEDVGRSALAENRAANLITPGPVPDQEHDSGAESRQRDRAGPPETRAGAGHEVRLAGHRHGTTLRSSVVMRKLAEPDYRPRMWREGRAWREYVGLLNDPVFQGVGVQRGQGRPALLGPGFMAGDRSLRVLGAWLKRMGYRTARAGIGFNVFRSRSTHLVELPFLEDLAARPLVPTASIYTRTDGVVSWHACLRGDLDCFEVKGTHVGLAVNPGVYRLIARRLAEVGR